MPELVQQSTPNPPPPIPPGMLPPDRPEFPAIPPAFDPAGWEDAPAFRFTFLMHITPPGYAEALQTLGLMLYNLLLETPAEWPEWQESTTRVEMKAAAADLRHLQGFLRSVARENKVSSLDVEDGWLSNLARKLAPQVGKLAGFIEKELAEGAGEVQG